MRSYEEEVEELKASEVVDERAFWARCLDSIRGGADNERGGRAPAGPALPWPVGWSICGDGGSFPFA